MILPALCGLYENLAKNPASGVALPDYSTAACSYVLTISQTGEFIGIERTAEGKKRILLTVPEQKGRTGSVPPPYFLCDNAKYLLGKGYDNSLKKTVPTQERVMSALAFHRKVAGSSDDAGLLAVIAFLEERVSGGRIDIPDNHPVYQGGTIVFRLRNAKSYIHDRSAAHRAWEDFCDSALSPELRGQCLITGKCNQPIAQTHKPLKGVADGNKTGCALVSFNLDSAESYGKSQSYNAPVSKKAMFMYTTALNHLLADKKSRIRIGDMTVVFWTERSGENRDASLISALLSSEVPPTGDPPDGFTGQEIDEMMNKVRSGNAANDPYFQVKICILGLAPNAARLSVRFWYEDTLENFIRHMGDHAENVQVIRSGNIAPRVVSMGDILRSITVKSNKKWWEMVPSSYESALLRAVISGDPYPASVCAALLMRIRAESGDEFGIDYIRAGYLKAYLLRYYQKENLNETMKVVCVSLNQESIDTAYSLGRLFAVIEALQQNVNGTATIRARYFASASSNPKLVFPKLLDISQHLIAKTAGKYFDNQIGAIMSGIKEFPAAMNLEEQGKFVLGYYHQREYIYTKKEDKDKMAV